jgi:hypothetical protein
MKNFSNDLFYWKSANNQDSVYFIEDKSKQYKIIENKKFETCDRNLWEASLDLTVIKREWYTKLLLKMKHKKLERLV